MGPADLHVYLETRVSRPVVWEAIPGQLRLELSVIDATAPLTVALDVQNEIVRSGVCEAFLRVSMASGCIALREATARAADTLHM